MFRPVLWSILINLVVGRPDNNWTSASWSVLIVFDYFSLGLDFHSNHCCVGLLRRFRLSEAAGAYGSIHLAAWSTPSILWPASISSMFSHFYPPRCSCSAAPWHSYISSQYKSLGHSSQTSEMAELSPSWYFSRLPYFWISAAHKAKSSLSWTNSICSDFDPSRAHSIQPVAILDSEPWTYQLMMLHWHFYHRWRCFGSIWIFAAKQRVSEPHRRPTASIFQGHYWWYSRSRECCCWPASAACTPGTSAPAKYQRFIVLSPTENCFSYLGFAGGPVFYVDFQYSLSSLYPTIPLKVYCSACSDPAADWAGFLECALCHHVE